MGFIHLILMAIVATSTAFVGTSFMGHNNQSVLASSAPTDTPTTFIPQPTTESFLSPTTNIPQPTIISSTPTTYSLQPTNTPLPTPKPKLTVTPVPTKPTSTPTPKPTSTPTPTNFIPQPTSTPTPTQPIAQSTSSMSIYDLVSKYAAEYSVDANVLRFIIQCESGSNPAITSANGLYAGLFQFSASTWSGYRNIMGEDPNPELRYNAEEAIQTGAFGFARTKGSIWPNCLP